VIEARLDKGKGPLATVLVRRGTLKTGDIFVMGSEWGKVRALVNDRGEILAEAPPSMPVEVLGISGTPMAGDRIAVVDSEATAREISDYRQRKAREKAIARQAGSRGSLEQMMSQLQSSDLREAAVVIKADVGGSAEAIAQALDKLSTAEVRARIVHSGVGGITESDVALAAASNAPILAFNVRASKQAKDAAEREGIERHERPSFVDHHHHAERRAFAPCDQAAGKRAFECHDADRIWKIRDLAQSRRCLCDGLFVQSKSCQLGVADTRAGGVRDVLAVHHEDHRDRGLDRICQAAQDRVLALGRDDGREQRRIACPSCDRLDIECYLAHFVPPLRAAPGLSGFFPGH
jgi:hypothetical protein